MHTEPTPHAPPAALHTSSDCIASSRVGARMSTRTPDRFCARSFSSKGRKKARVLPEPVLATPIVSRPAMIGGQHCAWIGVGAANLAHDFSTSPLKPASAKPASGRKLSALVPLTSITCSFQ